MNSKAKVFLTGLGVGVVAMLVMAASHVPILHGLLQSDLDANGHSITNLNTLQGDSLVVSQFGADSLTTTGVPTNLVADLAVHHNTFNATNIFEVWNGGGAIRFAIAGNGFATTYGNAEFEGIVNFDRGVVFNLGVTVQGTNTAPAVTNGPVGWFSISTTNGANFRVPFYQ